MLAKKTSGIKDVDLPLLRSVFPKSHLNQAIFGALEILVSAIYDDRKSYKSKVQALMSVLECLLADCLTRISPEVTSVVCEILLKYTLMLVLHGNWMNNKVIASHLQLLLNKLKLRAEKKKLFHVVSNIDYLLELMENDPWGSIVATILEGGRMTDEELLDFVRNELGVFLRVRVEVLVYAKCEVEASVIVKKCLDCISKASNSEWLGSSNQEVTHLKDLYLLILHMKKDIDQFKIEIEKMGFYQCLRFVKQCQKGELPVESVLKNTINSVVTVAFTVIREDTNEQSIRELIQLWLDVFRDDNLFEKVEYLVSNTACPRYIYLVGEELIKRVCLQPNKGEFCVGVFIRGLTLHVNEIKMCEINNDQVKLKELKVQFASAILQLAEYFKSDSLLYREFVLTAFSLSPSQNGLDMIRAVGQNKESVDKSESVELFHSEFYLSGKTQLDSNLNLTTIYDFSLPQILHLSLKENFTYNGIPGQELNPTISQCFQVYDSNRIGIPQSMCDDLSIVVNCVKNQTLSWELDRSELLERCEKYLLYESDTRAYQNSNIMGNQEENIRLHLGKAHSKSLKRKRKH